MATRRQIMQSLGFGLGALATATAPRSAVAQARHTAAAWSTQTPPWWLLSGLKQGSRVGRGWRISSLTAVQEGASVLTLTHRDEREARVHICAHHGQPRGLAHTALFDLVLMDGGQGDRDTPEDLGRVLLQLAAHIRRAELSDASELEQVTGLLTHAERVAVYGAEHLV